MEEEARKQHLKSLVRVVFAVQCLQRRAAEVTTAMVRVDEIQMEAVGALTGTGVLPPELMERLLVALGATEADLEIPRSVGIHKQKFDVRPAFVKREVMDLAEKHMQLLRMLKGVAVKVCPEEKAVVDTFISSTKTKWNRVESKLRNCTPLSSSRCR
jgi:hypothetical protein